MLLVLALLEGTGLDGVCVVEGGGWVGGGRVSLWELDLSFVGTAGLLGGVGTTGLGVLEGLGRVDWGWGLGCTVVGAGSF